jgi:excisionase family DNA binding protein
MGVAGDGDWLDVHEVARLVGRTPETVRRWVWTGRLTAVKRGNKLYVARSELAGLEPRAQGASESLAAWADLARELGPDGTATTASDLVLDDRRDRSAASAGR